MPCQAYLDAESKWESAKSTWTQYAYEQNRHLWGVSVTRRNQIVKESQAVMVENRQIMDGHQQFCEVCKKRSK